MNHRTLVAALLLGGMIGPVASMPLGTTPRGGVGSPASPVACTPAGAAGYVITACTIVIETGKPDDKARRAAAYFNRGSAYMIRGDNDRAIADFSASIALDPNQGKVFNNRALAYDAKGDAAHAIADFDQGLRLEPGDPAYLVGRGREYVKLDNSDRALADFDRAISTAPNFPFAYISRAQILFTRGDLERARADVAKYRQLMPSDPEGEKAEAAIRAQIHHQKN